MSIFNRLSFYDCSGFDLYVIPMDFSTCHKPYFSLFIRDETSSYFLPLSNGKPLLLDHTRGYVLFHVLFISY